MAAVQITVLKRTVNCDVAWKLQGGCEPCSTFEESQQFVSEHGEKPDRFCSWAWADIQRDVAMVMFGQGYPWVGPPQTAITCCTDGFRPVTFKVERVEE